MKTYNNYIEALVYLKKWCMSVNNDNRDFKEGIIKNPSFSSGAYDLIVSVQIGSPNKSTILINRGTGVGRAFVYNKQKAISFRKW